MGLNYGNDLYEETNYKEITFIEYIYRHGEHPNSPEFTIWAEEGTNQIFQNDSFIEKHE